MYRLILRLLVAALTFAAGSGAALLLYRFTPETWPADAVPAPEPPAFASPVPARGTCENPWMTVAEFEVMNGGRASSGPAIYRAQQLKAVSREAPVYPAEAKGLRDGGTVNVRVVVDEEGRVSKAFAGPGHPLLRDAAARAVCRWRFSPTEVSGRPARVVGQVAVNFSLE